MLQKDELLNSQNLNIRVKNAVLGVCLSNRRLAASLREKTEVGIEIRGLSSMNGKF
jgi:hypothetical protein